MLRSARPIAASPGDAWTCLTTSASRNAWDKRHQGLGSSGRRRSTLTCWGSALSSSATTLRQPRSSPSAQ